MDFAKLFSFLARIWRTAWLTCQEWTKSLLWYWQNIQNMQKNPWNKVGRGNVPSEFLREPSWNWRSLDTYLRCAMGWGFFFVGCGLGPQCRWIYFGCIDGCFHISRWLCSNHRCPFWLPEALRAGSASQALESYSEKDPSNRFNRWL